MSRTIDLLERMIYIRAVEEAIADRYAEQEMRCPTHLSIGQEAPAAAAGLCLRDTDYVVSTHRGHAHYLGRGGGLVAMIGELYGKVTGCARGRGGSMHLVDTSVGFMGTTAVVGNSIPVGLGLAKAIQLDGRDAVTCIFIGDAAVETGSIYESANFAATVDLPVLFVCENNLYSVYTPMAPRQPEGRQIHEMVGSIGLQVSHGNGNDADECMTLIAEAVSTIRNGGGPCFVELNTYRWREHCGPNYDNDLGYRTLEEFESWRDNDPIELIQSRIGDDSVVRQRLAKHREWVTSEIEEAFARAKAAPFPWSEEAYLDEYADNLGSNLCHR